MKSHNEHLIAFLNRLPITGDRAKWMDELRAALLELFPDVDRIAININAYCDPIYPHVLKHEEISVRFSKNEKKDGLAIENVDHGRIRSRVGEVGSIVKISSSEKLP